MVRYSEELVEEIRNANNIVDIISQYVILKKNGRNFLGLCPFHKEKTPSFCVSPEKQIFHCFGCGVGGDVISFISKMENINYRESIEFLAEKAGIELPTLTTGEDLEKKKLRERVFEINKKVALFYHENLYKPNAKLGQEYVKRRKLGNLMLKKFQIGFSGGTESVYDFLKKQGYTEEEILTSKLVRKSEEGRYFDLFKNRLMFPIFDVRGRVIAFGGRVLDDALPKYINSPDTIVYSKGRNLYALNFAKSDCSQNVIIVEGYMDCISLHQNGITNVVASLGTALTEAQGRLLRKFSNKIVIAYDSDGAGQSATLRGLDILSNLGFDVRILQMDGAKDPDEYVIKYGTDKFNLLVQNAISLIEFKVKMLKKDLDLQNVNDKIKFLKEIAKLLSKIDSKIEQELYLNKISAEYGVSKEAIYAEINKIGTKNQSVKILEKTRPVAHNVACTKMSSAEEKRENIIISLLIKNQLEMYQLIKGKIFVDDFKSETNKIILEKLFNEFEQKKNITNVLDLFQDEEVVNKVSAILIADYNLTNEEKGIANIINIYEKERLTNRKNEIIKKITTSDSDGIKQLEEELQEIIKKLTLI